MKVLMFERHNDVLSLKLAGKYQNQNLPEGLFEQITAHKTTEIVIDAEALESWDSSLLALLFKISQVAEKRHITITKKAWPAGVGELIGLASSAPVHTQVECQKTENILARIGAFGLRVYHHTLQGGSFVLQNLKIYFSAPFKNTAMRRKDFWFALENCGPKAVPIVLLISFMVGLILAFVGAVQLQMFGAEVYVASLVTIGMTRIMGAIMVGMIMAGRTGASYAATIGTMQVNEEIDALQTLGINVNEFLVLPRLKALVITLPLLTIFADFSGILGGAAVSILALNVPYSEFFKYASNAWFLKHFLVGLFHAWVYGFIISLCGCYFGVKCGRDADSVGTSTTNAVVYAIVWMIIATGIITFILQRMGI